MQKLFMMNGIIRCAYQKPTDKTATEVMDKRLQALEEGRTALN